MTLDRQGRTAAQLESSYQCAAWSWCALGTVVGCAAIYWLAAFIVYVGWMLLEASL